MINACLMRDQSMEWCFSDVVGSLCLLISIINVKVAFN